MSRVDVFCKYGDTGALPPDERVNYRRALMHMMQFDPSHRQRVNAAVQLLDIHARTLQ
jgi:hypothetical protein